MLYLSQSTARSTRSSNEMNFGTARDAIPCARCGEEWIERQCYSTVGEMHLFAGLVSFSEKTLMVSKLVISKINISN